MTALTGPDISTDTAPHAPAVKRLYTITEAASSLGISRSLVYELIDAGRLTRLHIGARALVTAESLDAFVASLQAA